MRVGALLILLTLAHPIALAESDASFYDLGPDPLADDVRAMEPKSLPAAGALDMLAETSSAYGVAKQNSRTVDLDEATILHAIPLSRASGVPLNVNDLANLDDASSRVSNDERSVTLEREDVFAALLLGVRPVQGGISDVLSTHHVWSSSDRTIQRVDLPEEETLGGLAFLARGLTLDPHELFSVSAQAQGGSRTRALSGLAEDPRLVQTVSLPRDTAFAAAPLLDGADRVEPLDLANATLRTSDSGAYARTTRLPESVLLAALAMDANDLPVDPVDTLSFEETKRVQRIDTTDIEFARETVTNALLLGARSGARS